MIVYVFILIRPVIPIITDVLDHQFSETIHISTIHAKYGSNHLDVEVASKSGENKPGSNQETNKSQDLAPLYIPEKETKINFDFNNLFNHWINANHNKLNRITQKIQERPPQFFI